MSVVPRYTTNEHFLLGIDNTNSSIGNENNVTQT